MLRRLYDWTMALAERPHAIWALAAVSFIESSIFPIPPDVLLIPMVLATRERAWRIAAVCTVASVVGGLAGWGIGYGLFESIGRPILDFYGYGAKFAEFQSKYNEWGAWIVAFAGLTPFPYKVITIASGVTQLDLVVFTIASVVSRGIRFYAVVWLCWRFGERVKSMLESNFGFWTMVTLVFLVGGFVVARYAF